MKIFEPYTINGKLALSNRLMMPPLVTRLATEDGKVTDELIDRYLLYARGGLGIVMTEAISVKEQKSGPQKRKPSFSPSRWEKSLLDEIPERSLVNPTPDRQPSPKALPARRAASA